ncbi:hypothetical protein E5675_05805 [Sphingopyxis sp. PAMC25046]|jgi:hypothetical protein|uniref:Uncharacterized protein n=3 Tax=Sphingopyxis TaxID=165697 RepID=A0A0N9V003_SPHMC|nr:MULTISPECIES: hypothetical protein [Sphingopyxis]QCB53995.1 hypothetical protein E5675_05805 [Sphingopyxis sp. PAMC25046]BBB09326.1 hypothetical protein SPYCW_2342 [Sphingopyxis sp. EG6]ALH81530.1 hypothetical protein AN936_14550 [Sphingopyxis macrogoltabida]AMU93166.1 hypothetical protein AOA14_00935 [Sphingopyxis terrae subsp. terrae NBRC 15098]KTE07334.1 hypothetical protein ATE71_15530 [Sphingopyxis sp. H115]
MKRPSLHPDELAMQLDAMLPADRALFDAAVAAVAERQALGWRFRLVMIESVMMAGLVLIAGLLVDQPTSLFTQASVTVGIACFASGLVLIWLSSVTSGLMLRWRGHRRTR